MGCRGQQMPAVVTAADLLGSCFQLSEGKRGTCRIRRFLGSFVVAGSSSRVPLRSHPIWLSLRRDHTSSCGISGLCPSEDSSAVLHFSLQSDAEVLSVLPGLLTV